MPTGGLYATVLLPSQSFRNQGHMCVHLPCSGRAWDPNLGPSSDVSVSRSPELACVSPQLVKAVSLLLVGAEVKKKAK